MAQHTSSIRLSIVFLNYNRLSETRQTVSQLSSLLKERPDIEIIAVDNGSEDGTADFLAQQKNLTFIETGKNLGIAGYNQGFEQARGDYILVLDDDSCPKDLDTIERLITQLDHNPKIGVIACKIINEHGQLQSSWHLPKQQKAGASMSFIGCGFAIRRDLFADIGWYPASFFLYQNEVDVAIQVRRHGYDIYYDPQTVVIHRGEASNRPNWRRVYYPTRNTIWLIRRYFPLHDAIYLIFSRLSIGLIRALQSREFTWYWKAVKEAFRQPVPSQVLPRKLRREFKAFWRQNSLWHQLTRQR